MPCSTYAGRGHPLADATNVDIETLAEWDWALAGSSALRDTFSAFFTERGIVPPGRLVQSSSIALPADMLSRNELLTVLPDPVAQAPLQIGRASCRERVCQQGWLAVVGGS